MTAIDYSFLPANPHRKLNRLSKSQIEFFNREGYISPLDALTENEAKQHFSYFNQLIDQWFATGGKDGYGLNCVHDRCEGLYDMIKHPVITDYVTDLLGDDVVCWASHYFSKAPNDPMKVAWHQDASYWKLTPARTVTVWLAVDDTDIENAAMQYIPRTHNLGRLKWHNAGKNAVLDQEITDIKSFEKPVHNILKAGQLSLHADMLAHGSSPNDSDRRRCGLTMRYCPTKVLPIHKDWGLHTVQIKGNKADHWKYVDRPRGEHLNAATYVDKHIGSN
jgi:non-haem Fe2+, alpha-ketoglutarate-dependent halogenase